MLGLAMLVIAAAVAQPELAPGTSYDPGIPTLQQVLGHDFGQEITPPEGITTYLEALSAAAPERTSLVRYADSWEGRPLHVLAIGSPERLGRVPELKAALRRLADPRQLTAAEAEPLLAELPVVVWLAHAVHGNEVSSSDAALALAYHLLAAQTDETVETVLREAVVLIDPLQNPDGRARFVSQNLQARAAVPDPEPTAAEHDEPWPRGRGNHYLFDMNRDWFAQTQLETVGRVKLLLEWFPQVVVDLHEMGGDSTYYFAPPAAPENPHITPQQHGWLEAFGKANAARFDERGFAYFIREIFDSFYPGYGESWPMFQGAIGMTYEQASPRGLVYRRTDEAELTYREAVVRHFTAALSTAATAARNREGLLRDFLEYRRSAVEQGERGPIREYLIPQAPDPTRAQRLVDLLVAQGIEVRLAAEPIHLEARSLPAGTYVIPLAQPAGRLARNLLDPEIALPRDFVIEQQRRLNKRLRDEVYDLTAWSLPLLFDVECLPAERPSSRSVPYGVASRKASAGIVGAKVGYLVPWGSGAVAGVAEALRDGLKARTAGKPFKLDGRNFAGGTVLFRAAENPAKLGEDLGRLAARHGLEVVPVDSGWVEEGISLGSNEVRALKSPAVLLAWDEPTSSQSAGWARYVLERRFEQPVTVVRVGSLGRVDLSRYDVLVLPSGAYDDALGKGDLARVKGWVREGGTLVTLGEASRWAAREKVGLLKTRTELKDGRPEPEPGEDESKPESKKPEKPEQPIDLEQALEPEDELPLATPGALLRVELDLEHWLAAGTDGEVQAVVDSRRIFTPIKYDQGRNVGLYAPAERLVASGLAWDDSKQSLANKAYLIHQPMGAGHVVAFAEDPNYRAFAEATELLFMNAVLLGPAH